MDALKPEGWLIGRSEAREGPSPARRAATTLPMTDLIYIGISVLFFVVSGLYVRFCEKL